MMICGMKNKKTTKIAAVLVLCAFIMTILPVLPAEAAVVTRINTSAVNLTDKSDYAVVNLDSLADQEMTVSMLGDYLTCFQVEISGDAITPQNSTINAADTSTTIAMGKDTSAALKISLNHAAVTDILLPPPVLGKVRVTDGMGKNYEVTVTYNGSSIGQVYTSTNVINLKQDVIAGDGDEDFYVWLDSTAENGENVVIALDTERDGTTGMYRDNFYALLLNAEEKQPNAADPAIMIQQPSGETGEYNGNTYPKVANGKSIVVKMTHNEPLKIRIVKKDTTLADSNLMPGAKLGKVTFTVVGSNRGSGADVYYEQEDVTLNRISFRESTLSLAKGSNYFFHPVFEPTGTNVWDLVWASDDPNIVSFKGESLGRKNTQIGLLTAHEVTDLEKPVKVRVYSRANPSDIQDELFVYVYEAFNPKTDYAILHDQSQPNYAKDIAAARAGTPNVERSAVQDADGTEKITIKGFSDPFYLGLIDPKVTQSQPLNGFVDECGLPETMEELIWTSGNSTIVKIEQINNGTVIVTPRKVGSTFIKVKGKTSGNVKIFQINIEELPLQTVTMDRSLGFELGQGDNGKDLLKIAEGNRVTLDVEVVPYNATNIDLRWKSNNTDLVVVDSKGTMRALEIDPKLVDVMVYNYDRDSNGTVISDTIQVQVVQPLLIPYIDIHECYENAQTGETEKGGRIDFSYRYSINTTKIDPKEPTFQIVQGETAELWVEYAIERDKVYQHRADDVLWEPIQKNLVWLDYKTDREVQRIKLEDNTGAVGADSDWYTLAADGDHILYTAHLELKATTNVKKTGEIIRVVGTNVYYEQNGKTPALDCNIPADTTNNTVERKDIGYPGFYVEIEPIPPTAIVISGTPKILAIGKSKQLKVSTDNRVKDKRVIWEIIQIEKLDTTNGATDSSGLVDANNVRNDNGRFDLSKGEPYYTPLILTNDAIATYAVIDENTGIITGKRACRALVRATSVSDPTISAEAYVYIGTRVKSAKLNETSLTMKEGDTFDLNVAMQPHHLNTDYFGTSPEAEPKIIKFESENPYIAEVDPWTGKVTAINGSLEDEYTYIYAYIGNNEKRLRCRVNIVASSHTWTDIGGIKENTKVEIDAVPEVNFEKTYQSDVQLRVGKSMKLYYRMVESKADIADVKWYAATDNVFVDQVGNVVALGNTESAKATVYVVLQDKSGKMYKVTYNITIKPELKVGNDFLGYDDSLKVELTAGQTVTLKALIAPSEDLEGDKFVGDWTVTEWKTTSRYVNFYTDQDIFDSTINRADGEDLTIKTTADLGGKKSVNAVIKVKNKASGETATINIKILARK